MMPPTVVEIPVGLFMLGVLGIVGPMLLLQVLMIIIFEHRLFNLQSRLEELNPVTPNQLEPDQ